MAETMYVKWRTPAEELTGIAALAAALVERDGLRGEDICLAVPNRNWAAQAHRACELAGLQSTVCIAPARWDRATRRAVSALGLLARPESAEARAAWAEANGCAVEEAQRFVEEHGAARGHSLARRAGLASAPACAQVLLHLEGEEDAARMEALLRAQLAHPTLPPRGSFTPIVHHRAIEKAYDWVFLIGCVEGLLPCAAAFEADDADARAQALEADRNAFLSAPARTRKRLVASSFAKIDAETARQARIRRTRCKQEHGSLVAMTAPTRFLEEMGTERPSTIGGQTLLREYGLN